MWNRFGGWLMVIAFIIAMYVITGGEDDFGGCGTYTDCPDPYEP